MTQAQSSSLPAMQPTTVAATTAATTTAATTSTAASPQRKQPAQVSLRDGLLEVRADDASLNQILRSISRLTGLTIAGGVADQPVFGNYGPAQPSQVLATLLDGTGVNMLYKAGDAAHAPQLILSQRSGGPSPPSPASVAEGYQPPMQPPVQQPVQQQQPMPGNTYNLNQPEQQQPQPQQEAQPAAQTPAAAPGALTPEQVYQQLLKMQHGNTSTSTTPPNN